MRAQAIAEILHKITVEIEASGRHVHLTAEAVEQLFGAGHTLTRVRDLSQPGQFVCAERLRLVGPKGELKNVVVLGPARPVCQVEVSLTDAVTLGITPPLRLSGDVSGTAEIRLCSETGQISLPWGLIVAKRHLHITQEDAALLGLEDGQVVSFQTFTARPVLLQEMPVRVSKAARTVVHLDYDEANACGFRKGDRGFVMP